MILKERYFNYRPLALAFISILLGSFLSYYAMVNIIVFYILTSILAVVIVLLLVVNKKLKEPIIMILFTIVGALGFILAVNSYNKIEDNSVPTIVTGKIATVKSTDTYTSAVIEDVYYDDEKKDFNIITYVNDNTGTFEDIKVGNVISFKPYRITDLELFNDDNYPNTYNYTNNIKCRIHLYAETIEVLDKDINMSNEFKNRIKSNLDLGLNASNSSLMYSSLFGDKTDLDKDAYSYFKSSGVAHLLAVSGLHVGIIVMILSKFLDGVKANKFLKLFIVSLILIGYSYLCDFTFSVVRASIMVIVMLISKCFYKEYDSLSSLGLAGIIIFLINPLSIFDVGFLLSFLSVFGIVAMYRPISRVISKCKLGSVITASLSISISVLVSIMFVQIYFFDNLNIISLLSNLILIPLFTFAFSISFVVALLSLAIPYLAYLLYPINYIFSFIQLVTNILGQLSFANISIVGKQFSCVIIYFLLILVLSRFCVAKKKYKVTISSFILAILIGVLL